jgi:polar amino acid transport system substrate-binding protein
MRSTMRLPALALAAVLLGSCAMPNPSTSSLAHEFAPGGVLRIGVNYGNPVIAQKDPAGGAPRGVGPELGRELGRRLGVPVSYATYDTAGKMATAAGAAWDVAFLANDPARANEIGFSKPYVQIEGTYMVRAGSPLRSIADVDRDGVRIAVGDKTAYDLYLTRALKHAKLVKAPTSKAAIELFLAENLDAVGGVKNPLVAVAAKDPGLRVIEGNFMVIGQAAGVPKARANAQRYLHDFIEEAKRSGFVAKALAASGVTDATVAP